VPQVRVQVTRDGEQWSAEFEFDRGVAAWVLPRSDVTRDGGKPWRPQSWSVETRGVRLQRRGFYDVLTADRGEVPLHVRVRFTPFAAGLQADYAPALAFTDGSVALYAALRMFPRIHCPRRRRFQRSEQSIRAAADLTIISRRGRTA
jgi:hypothetical protein